MQSYRPGGGSQPSQDGTGTGDVWGAYAQALGSTKAEIRNIELHRREHEQIIIRGLHGELKPRQKMMAEIVAADGGLKRVPLICRIDTLDELDYFKNGGILQYVLRHLAA